MDGLKGDRKVSYWQAAVIDVDVDEGVNIHIRGCINSIRELSELIEKLCEARDEYANYHGMEKAEIKQYNMDSITILEIARGR